VKFGERIAITLPDHDSPCLALITHVNKDGKDGRPNVDVIAFPRGSQHARVATGVPVYDSQDDIGDEDNIDYPDVCAFWPDDSTNVDVKPAKKTAPAKKATPTE
jgi:hypothetical protein